MADFFTRLAERALGTAPVAAPDLPPMFAPQAQTLEVSALAIAPRGADATGPEKTAAAEAPVENPPAREPVEALRQAPRRQDEPSPPLVKIAPPIDALGDTGSSNEREETNLQPALLVKTRSVSRFGDAAPRAPAAVALPARSEAAPPGAPFSEALVASALGAAAAPPAIHVTIGRVEVRAVAAPAEAARPRERKAPPLRSLDQYLRERNEGRR